MHRVRATVAAVMMTVLVAACGSTPSTQSPSSAPPAQSAAASTAPATAAPVATAAPTEAPSSSAEADVAAAFNQTLSDPLWSPHLNIQAVSTIGTMTIPMTGTVDVNLGTSRTVLSYGQGNAATTEETISNGSVKYTKQFGGWFRSTDTSSSSLGKLITGASGFTDAGVETKAGQKVHHMVLPAGTVIPGDALSVPDGATDTQIALEAWADGEGNPVAIGITASWTQPSGTAQVPVKIAMEFAVAGSAQAITVPTEDDLWAIKTSGTQRMQFAVPATWEYTKGSTKKPDYFDGYDGSFIVLMRQKAGGYSLNKWVNYARTNLADWSGLKGAKLVKASAVKLDGVPARVLRIKGTYKGTAKTQLDVIAVKGGYLYEVVLSVPRTATAADLAAWQTILTSFKFK